MSSTANREAIIQKLRALKAKTTANGCTEQEALAAAAAIETLLRKYAIERDELDVREQSASYATQDFNMDARLGRHVRWVASAISKLTETTAWFPGGSGQAFIRFFGEEPDVEVATYLMAVCERAIEAEWFVYSFAQLGTPDRVEEKSFKDGCASRISERLTEMRKAKEAAVNGAGKALVVLTKDMVRKRMLKEVHNIDKFSRGSGRSGARDGQSWAAGRAAGDNVTFHSGVRHSSHGAQKIAGRALLG